MSNPYCLQNSRNVSPTQKCYESSISFTQQDHIDGLRITANTLRFKNREKLKLRLTNTYTFGKVNIVFVWNNTIGLVNTPSVAGAMKMYPQLSSIWVTVDGNPVNGTLPADMISKMRTEINNLIGNRYVLINDIHIDQIEMLKVHKILKSPDFVFEKLLIYTDIQTVASNDMIEYRREIPDDIELLVTITKVLDTKIDSAIYRTKPSNVKQESLFNF
jgi:hypothetical protein